jgi:hypothetical protein
MSENTKLICFSVLALIGNCFVIPNVSCMYVPDLLLLEFSYAASLNLSVWTSKSDFAQIILA